MFGKQRSHIFSRLRVVTSFYLLLIFFSRHWHFRSFITPCYPKLKSFIYSLKYKISGYIWLTAADDDDYDDKIIPFVFRILVFIFRRLFHSFCATSFIFQRWSRFLTVNPFELTVTETQFSFEVWFHSPFSCGFLILEHQFRADDEVKCRRLVHCMRVFEWVALQLLCSSVFTLILSFIHSYVRIISCKCSYTKHEFV